METKTTGYALALRSALRSTLLAEAAHAHPVGLPAVATLPPAGPAPRQESAFRANRNRIQGRTLIDVTRIDGFGGNGLDMTGGVQLGAKQVSGVPPRGRPV
jgi:hypothetical protein